MNPGNNPERSYSYPRPCEAGHVADPVVNQPKKLSYIMNKSTRFIITAAAMAGLYAGSLAIRAHAADTAGTPATKDATKDKSSCKGKDGCKGAASCKGHNDCAGKGGCKSGDNGCKGKNSCKGKGGCAAAMPAAPEKK